MNTQAKAAINQRATGGEASAVKKAENDAESESEAPPESEGSAPRPQLIANELRAILNRRQPPQTLPALLRSAAPPADEDHLLPLNGKTDLHQLTVVVSQLHRDLEDLAHELKQAVNGINSQLALNSREQSIRFAGYNRQLSEVSARVLQFSERQACQAVEGETVSDQIADLHEELLRLTAGPAAEHRDESASADLTDKPPPAAAAVGRGSVRVYESIFYGLILMLLSLIASMQLYGLFYR